MCSDSAQFTFSLTHQGASKFGISSVGVSVTNAENIIYALPSLPTHMIFPFFHLGGAAAARKRCQEICQFGVGFPKKKKNQQMQKKPGDFSRQRRRLKINALVVRIWTNRIPETRNTKKTFLPPSRSIKGGNFPFC